MEMKKSNIRKASALVIVTFLGLFAGFVCLARSDSYEPKEGDLVFQSLPVGDLVETIEGVSNSRYSHVGLIVSKNGTWYVREAIGMVIGMVTETPLSFWIVRGRNASFDVYRLKDPYKGYVKKMVHESEKYLGRPYDYKYELDDETIYCSELIYKSFLSASGAKLGKLVKLGDMNWKPYEKTIIKYEGGPVPLDRMMITPRHLSEADELEKVYSTY